MKKLKIAQVAPLWYPIPPKKYGGIEKIVHYLTEGLVKKGHKVTLFASGNSKTKAKLLSCRQKGLAEDKIPWTDGSWPLQHLAFAFQQINKGDFDIVHAHTGLRTFFFQNFTKTPVLHTFHNPLDSDPKKLPPALAMLNFYKNSSNVVFISQSHRSLCPIKIKNSSMIYNGIDEKLFAFSPAPQDYFLWAGRMEKAKGVKNAVKAARKAKIKLYLVGKTDPAKIDYFKSEIKPLLNEKIKFLGEKSQNELVRLYQGAKALLYPIEWNEPFGLVMAEAMACGAPVIVFDRGSAKEIVRDKKTGFVVPFFNQKGKKNIEGLINAIKNIDQIKRSDCRKQVEQNFTLQKMVDNYETLYFKLLKTI